MLRVGLTGGLGSGKSTVAKIFETLGVPVYYADAAAKRLMNEDEQLKERIVENFGKESYQDKLLNRHWLASAVFNNPQKLALLNSLVHPVTIADAEAWMKMQKTAYAVKEAALIFESDAYKHLDYVIGVSAPYALRVERGMRRDGVSKSTIEDRMSKQMDETQKMERCNFIINNDEKELLIPQVLKLHEILILRSVAE